MLEGGSDLWPGSYGETPLAQQWSGDRIRDEYERALVAAPEAGEVMRFKPDATLDQRIKLPAKMVTSLTFGGPGLQDLYIVTADNTDRPERGGSVFRLSADEVGVRGVLVPPARI